MTDFSIFFIIINTWQVVRIFKSTKVHLLFKILLGISYFGWNAVPAILMYIPNMLGIDSLTTDTYIQCSYYNQVFLFFSYSFAFWLIKKKKSLLFISKNDYQNSKSFFSSFVTISLVLAIYKCYTLIMSQDSYWDGNNIDNITALGPIDFLSSMAISFLAGTILICRNSFKPSLYRLCFAVVAGYLLIQTFRGGRIYIFGLVIILLYYGLSEHKTRLIIGTGIVGVIGLSLLPILGSLRGENKIQFEDISNASSTPTGQLVVVEVLTKTNSVLYGSYLLEKDGVGKWDGKMYTSTIYAVIPRFIYPFKPEPGSVDGSQYGLPARASAEYSAVGEYNNMGSNGVPASLSSLWGGGWIAYIFEMLSSGFLLFLINCIFYSKKSLFVSFVISLINFPATIMEVPLPTILIQVQRYIVIYFVIRIFFLNQKSNKSIINNRNYGKITSS